MALVKHMPRMASTPVYSSPPETRSSVTEYGYRNSSPGGSECSPMTTMSNGRCDDRAGIMRHSLSGQFPSVSLFKEYQDAAMAVKCLSIFPIVSSNRYFVSHLFENFD